MGMASLVVLYVTVGQEQALHQLYTSNTWVFNNLEIYLSREVKDSILSAREHSQNISLKHANNNGLHITPDHTNTGGTVTPHGSVLTYDTIKIDDTAETTGEHIPGTEAVTCGLETESEKSNKLITEKKLKQLKTTRPVVQIRSLRTRSQSSTSGSHTSTGNSVLVKRNLKKTQISENSDAHVEKNIYKLSEDTDQEDANCSSSSLEIRETNIGDPVFERNVRITTKTRTVVSAENNETDVGSPVNLRTRTSFRNKLEQVDEDELVGKVDRETHVEVNDSCASRKKQRIYSIKVDKSKNIIKRNLKRLPRSFKCEKCSYVAGVRSNLNRHVREIHSGIRHSCSKCDKSFKGKHDAKMHEIYGHSSVLQCIECDKTFSSVSGLRNHIKIIHKKSALYDCPHCDMKFYYKSHYYGHLNKHLDVKPFSCQKCDKPFRYKVACRLHEKTCFSESYYKTHHADGSVKVSTKSKILCDICGTELKSKSSLKMHHYYTHSDDANTVCSLCGKSFKGTYSLRRHMKNVHEDNGVRYPCPDCKREFSQLQVFKQHMKLHKQAYICFCDTCGKGFLSKFKMTEHMRTHTGEKPFSCPHCQSYKCATKTNLQKHMKIHEEGRLPRQRVKSSLTRKKSAKLKAAAHSSEDINDGVYTAEPALKTSEAYVEPVYVSLQMSSADSYVRSVEYIQGQGQYTTTLPVMSIDDSSVRYRQPGYNHVYVDQQSSEQTGQSHNNYETSQRGNDVHGDSNYETSQRGNDVHGDSNYETSQRGNDVHGDSNYDIRRHQEIGGQGHASYDPTTEQDKERSCHSNYEMSSHGDGYYDNEPSCESTELPQGLNILTVAMNIVNPSQY